jgi:hypothetical protein
MDNGAANKTSAVNGEAGPRQENGNGELRERRRQGRMDRIARRAHEIYERRGGEHGKALEDWLQAEREIDAESER